MNFYDYADAINANLIIHKYANQNNRWTASFESCEVSENEAVLCSAYGNGGSAEGAIIDYISQIAEKKIVFNAMSKDYRREFKVPANLTL